MREFFKQAMKVQTKKISEGCMAFVFGHVKIADLERVKKGHRVRAPQLIEYENGLSLDEGALGTVRDFGASPRGGFTGVLMIEWDAYRGALATSYDSVELVTS